MDGEWCGGCVGKQWAEQCVLIVFLLVECSAGVVALNEPFELFWSFSQRLSEGLRRFCSGGVVAALVVIVLAVDGGTLGHLAYIPLLALLAPYYMVCVIGRMV